MGKDKLELSKNEYKIIIKDVLTILMQERNKYLERVKDNEEIYKILMVDSKKEEAGLILYAAITQLIINLAGTVGEEIDAVKIK